MIQRALAVVVAVAALACATAFAEDRNITIDAKDTTSEWVLMFDRGVNAGVRLNASCKKSDYADIELNDEPFAVCRSFKAFMQTPQFASSPPAFQLGFLSALK